MKFNVAKWHSMRVTRHLNQIHYNYTLHQQTLEQFRYLGLTITDNLDGVNVFLKFLVKQLRHLVFLVWLLHIGIQKKLHTKYWFVLRSSMQPYNDTETDKEEKVSRGQQPGAGDGGTVVASTICWTISSGHSWRTAGRSLSTLFYKIHSGTVSPDKD